MRADAFGPRPDVALQELGPPIPASFSISHIEVIQVVQNVAHQVPFVAGKPTFVRIFLDRPDAHTVNVRGEIEVKGAGGFIANVPSMNAIDLAPGGDPLNQRRLSLDASLNFLLPANATSAGTLRVSVAEIVLSADGTPVPRIGPAATRSVDFVDTPPLRVHLVSLRHKAGNPAVTHEPKSVDHAMIESWLLRAYPVSSVSISRVTVDAKKTWPFKSTDINAQLTAIRNIDMGSGGDRLAHYYGIVSDGGGTTFMRGSASVIPASPDPTAVASGPAGSSLFSWDTDGSYADWYAAHEIGHTFGRPHLGSGCGDVPMDPAYPFPAGQISDASNDFVGLDRGDAALGLPMRICPGTTSHDVMSYCNNIWMSSRSYAEIHDRISKEAAELAAAAVEGVLAGIVVMSEFLNVIGTVNLTQRTAEIDYMHPVSLESAPPAESDSRGVEVRGYAADGTLLIAQPARLKFNTCIDDDDEEIAILDAYIPRLPDARRIAITIDGNEVAEWKAPPPVEAGLLQEAAPPDLRFTVQVSIDDGATWRTIAVGLEDPDAYTLNRRDFAASPALRLRVLATDGFNSWEVRNEPIANQ